MDSDIDVASLMMKHFEVEFVFDKQGRIRSANYWTDARAAKFVLGITRTNTVWAFGAELPEEVCHELERVARLEDFDPSSSPHHTEQYLSIVSNIYSDTKRELYDSLTYWFPATGGSSLEKDCILIDSSNQSLLEEHFEHMLGYQGKVIEYDQPIVALVIDGVAVSVCSSARSNEEAHECYVLTASEYRQTGYATNVVKSWANTLKSKGLIPLYNTSIGNEPAQTVARKAGFSLYGRALRIH